jgi:hypothetical protein
MYFQITNSIPTRAKTTAASNDIPRKILNNLFFLEKRKDKDK